LSWLDTPFPPLGKASTYKALQMTEQLFLLKEQMRKIGADGACSPQFDPQPAPSATDVAC